jgi:hypothetical protein
MGKRKMKRGQLGTLAEAGDAIVTPSKIRDINRSKSSSSKSSAGRDAAQISPALAEWMATTTTEVQQDDYLLEEDAADDDDDEDENDVSFQSFDDKDSKNSKRSNSKSNNKNISSRRVKQSERFELEEQRTVKIEKAIDTLVNEALEDAGNLQGILTAVRALLTIPQSGEQQSLKLLLGGKKRWNYRLAWVGSDDAVCHVGTGLHKVPLARLQEVFLSSLGRNRLEILEVIRILGPFPNVKNTLQGNIKYLLPSPTIITSNTNDVVVEALQVVMDSMVDGTGKEILAGTEDNIRRVNLQVYFADERAIVMVVPPPPNEDGDDDSLLRADPLENNGANVLVFVQEKEMDEKLEALRVN